MNHRRNRTEPVRPGILNTLLPLLLVALLASACGGGGGAPASEPAAADEATAAPANAGRVVPTMPAARFAAPTTMIDATKVAESGATPEPGEVDVEFGGQVYTRLCADCHGDALEGVSGKAEPIDAYTLDEDALADLLRTGGGFGPEHLFGLDKVSPEGIASLQAHLQSIGASE